MNPKLCSALLLKYSLYWIERHYLCLLGKNNNNKKGKNLENKIKFIKFSASFLFFLIIVIFIHNVCEFNVMLWSFHGGKEACSSLSEVLRINRKRLKRKYQITGGKIQKLLCKHHFFHSFLIHYLLPFHNILMYKKLKNIIHHYLLVPLSILYYIQTFEIKMVQ